MTVETFSEIGINRPSIKKDPNATLDYTFDWTDWLAALSDSIVSYTITVDGVTLVDDSRSGALITVWVSGGTVSPGTPASVTCRITTASTPPRVTDQTIYLIIEER